MKEGNVRITYEVEGMLKVSCDITKAKALEIFEEFKLAVIESFKITEKAEIASEEISKIVENAQLAAIESAKMAEKAEIASEETSKIVEKVQPAAVEKSAEVSKIATVKTQTIYEKILNFMKEGKDCCYRKEDICSVLKLNKVTVTNYLNKMLKEGEVIHPEGKSIRWYCAVVDETHPEEVAVEEETVQPEEAAEADDTQLEKFMKNEIYAEIIEYVLTKSKFQVRNARNKFKIHENEFCNVVNFLNEINWIEFLEDEEAYKVRGYAIIWYVLKRANKPLTLDEIMEQGRFTKKENVERVLKNTVEKELVEEIGEDGEARRYVAKMK